jgi:hypothetical protein
MVVFQLKRSLRAYQVPAGEQHLPVGRIADTALDLIPAPEAAP